MTDGCEAPRKSEPTAWNVDLADRLFAPPRRLKSYAIADPDFDFSTDEDSRQISGMEKWCFEIADAARNGAVVIAARVPVDIR
jgi:hypothetical protein